MLRDVHRRSTAVCSTGGDAGTGHDSAVTWEDRKTQKACLERYRVASAEIIAVFHEVAPEAVVEKASIDEAYIDVTSIVDAHLQVCTLNLASIVTIRTTTSDMHMPSFVMPQCSENVHVIYFMSSTSC